MRKRGVLEECSRKELEYIFTFSGMHKKEGTWSPSLPLLECRRQFPRLLRGFCIAASREWPRTMRVIHAGEIFKFAKSKLLT